LSLFHHLHVTLSLNPVGTRFIAALHDSVPSDEDQ
jgi:hypothetical protein